MDKHPGLGPADDFRTEWRGRWYRHETEIRWSYLFSDELGLEPEFEPSSVKLPFGGHRPDFYLPRLAAWAEIKAGRPDELALGKAQALARATGRVSLLLSGLPSDRPACWVFRPGVQSWAGPLMLHSWLPLDGLAFTSAGALVVVRIGGGVYAQALRGAAPPQAGHMRASISAAMQLPLMPQDRLRIAG